MITIGKFSKWHFTKTEIFPDFKGMFQCSIELFRHIMKSQEVPVLQLNAQHVCLPDSGHYQIVDF